MDRLITALGNAIYFPYLAPVVILGAIWLAWQGLIRKRATRTIEGTLWMVVACVAAIALIGRPADVHRGRDHGLQRRHRRAEHRVLQAARPGRQQLPAGADRATRRACPATSPSPRATPWWTRTPTSCGRSWCASPGCTGSSAAPRTRPAPAASRPWSTSTAGSCCGRRRSRPTRRRAPRWSRPSRPPTAGIASSMQQQDPAVYPLFQGNQWTTRLEIAFAAMFAALVAGLLILLIALTLIVLKLGFLLLLVAGPFFLIVGTHPGFGRVIAIRWFEMLVGVLMKSAAVAIVLSRPALLLLADHGHGGYRAALGAEDLDDRAGHGGGVHLPQAVLAPVLRGRLRHARLDRAGRVQPARGGPHLPPVHPGRRDRGRPGDGELPGRPVGAPEPGAGGRGGRRGGGRRGGGVYRRGSTLRRAAGAEAAGPRPARRAPGPATPTHRGSARTRRPRPTGTARRAEARAGWPAGPPGRVRPGPGT